MRAAQHSSVISRQGRPGKLSSAVGRDAAARTCGGSLPEAWTALRREGSGRRRPPAHRSAGPLQLPWSAIASHDDAESRRKVDHALDPPDDRTDGRDLAGVYGVPAALLLLDENGVMVAVAFLQRRGSPAAGSWPHSCSPPPLPPLPPPPPAPLMTSSATARRPWRAPSPRWRLCLERSTNGAAHTG
jgi:hypothetical protein